MVRFFRTYGAKDMAEVPNFLEDSSVLSTAEERNGASLGLQSSLQLRQRVGSLVRRDDTGTTGPMLSYWGTKIEK